MICSPALNSSSFDSVSSRSRSFSSRTRKRSEVTKANMRVTLPDPTRMSTADAEAEVGEAGLGRPRVPARAAQLRRMRVPGAAAGAAQQRAVHVGAPFPDVASAVVEAVRTAVLRDRADRQRVARAAAVGGERRVPLVAPGKAAAVVAAGGAFPFGFGRQAHSERAREGVGLVPAHADDRLVRTEIRTPLRVVPEARLVDPVRRSPFPAGRRPARGVLVMRVLYKT